MCCFWNILTSRKTLFWFQVSSKVHFRSVEGQTFYWSIDDSWWQMSVSGMTGQVGSFQNTVVYLQAFPYLSSPLPSHSYSHTIFCVVFDSHSSFFALKPNRNACYLYGGKFIIYKYDEVNLGCKFITYKSWSFTLPSVNLLFIIYFILPHFTLTNIYAHQRTKTLIYLRGIVGISRRDQWHHC